MIKIVNFLGSSYSLKNTFSAFDIRIYNEKWENVHSYQVLVKYISIHRGVSTKKLTFMSKHLGMPFGIKHFIMLDRIMYAIRT